MLNLIDHLPSDTHFMQMVSLDEEHAEMLYEARRGAEPEPYAPPMSTWSAEAAMLAVVIDELRALRYITQAVNSTTKPNAPVPYTRPKSVMEKVSLRRRQQAHQSLVARVLPEKET